MKKVFCSVLFFCFVLTQLNLVRVTKYCYSQTFLYILVAASWYKSNVMDVLNESLTTGGDPNVSDAYTINGEPGDLYDCSNGTYTKSN